MYGFYRFSVAVPKTTVANPKKNLQEILTLAHQAHQENSVLVLFPELSLTGYSVGDLFFNQTLLLNQEEALATLLQETNTLETIIIVGMAILHQQRLYNCAVVIQSGKILGVVPKTYLPNKKEFYEHRHFVSGKNIQNQQIQLLNQSIPFGIDLLFGDKKDLLFGIEICEDLWSITPPSNQMAINGANLILNLSASNELIGKASYREELVRTQSARCMSGYLYSSAGVGESTTDTLFGGHGIIADYGSTLIQSQRFEWNNQLISADIDLQRLNFLRLSESSFSETTPTPFRYIKLKKIPQIQQLKRFINPHPFVPSIHQEQAQRCEEIINIQAHSLIKRMRHAKIKKAIIGISGGLDSTLALLSTHYAFKIMGWNSQDIIAITMPGFGTTSRTKNNATTLCEALGVELRTIEITPLCLEEFHAIGHDPKDHSVTYENVQARARTSILMNSANREGGLVIGTGDLSEVALGWSTYNGDHMSMYALNVGIPKTLIKYVIAYYQKDPKIAHIIEDILNTPISPELLPHQEDKIIQETESIVGPYELHDFFLYHFIKYGATPEKILFLAQHAFDGEYDKNTIKKWLKKFLWRFFTQQFKRSCMPDGPKVGTISLSPRADWRMPSDADMANWIEGLD